jgi:superfamily II DNA or RNA helicase
MPDRPKLRPVLIRKAGNALQVIPAHTAILGPELTFTRRKQQGGWRPGSGQRKIEYEDVQLFQTSTHDNIEGEFLFAPAGLLNRIITALRKWGIAYTYEDARPIDIGEPDWSAVEQCREGQDVVLAKIATCDMGQIEAPTGEGKTWLIVQICKIYPKIPIVIVTASIDEAQSTRSRLLEALPSTQIGQIGGGKKQKGKRVTVCVKNSLLHADLAGCKLMLFDECHTAGSDVTSKTLMHANNCKRFGFSASPERRSDKADMAVEAIFGPVIHVTTYQESQGRGNVVPITVIMRSVLHGPDISSKNSTVVNRHGIWRNEYRNRLIARDIDEFTKNDEQLLVATDVVEHALEISRFRSGVQLVYSNMSKQLRSKYTKADVLVDGEHPITLRDRARLQVEFQAGTLRKVLTTCWKRGVDFPHLQVLIRCDGSGSAINNTQLPGRLSRLDDGKITGYLVDYLDEFNPTLNNRAKRRIRDYRSRGWTVIMPKTIGAG